MIAYERRRLWWLWRCTCDGRGRDRIYRRTCKRHGYNRMVDGWTAHAR